MKKALLICAACACALAAQGKGYPYGMSSLQERGVAPIKAEPADGLGYLMAPNGRSVQVAGAAWVCGGARPDLFLYCDDRAILARYIGDDENGAPVFEFPKDSKTPFGLDCVRGKGALFQDKKGNVHWLELDGDKTQLVDFIFDKSAGEFEQAATAPLPQLPAKRAPAAAVETKDGGLDVFFVFSLAGPPNPHLLEKSDPRWVPQDCNGVSVVAPYFAHHYLMRVHYPRLLGGKPSAAVMVSPEQKDILAAPAHASAGVYAENEPPSALIGTRFGNIHFYTPHPITGTYIKRFASDKDGSALRHYNIGCGVAAYPNKDGTLDGFITGGEGLVYYYPSLRKRGENGAPLFGAPLPVRAKDMPLNFCPLATPDVVDWDGDGALDILTGGSEGIVLFCKNLGTNECPKFDNGKPVFADGEMIHIQAGYSGSVQGSQESRWGYIAPRAFDWNGDGLPDLIVGDIRGEYTVYMNRGTKTEPKLDAGVPLYCNGLELRGRWRCGAAAAVVGDERILAIVDADARIRLYRRIDDYNVEDTGDVARLENGEAMTVNFYDGGGSGRCKLNLADWDGDGNLDLVIGTGRVCAVPNRESGYPTPLLSWVNEKGKWRKPYGTILFAKNLGTNTAPIFAHPVPFAHEKSPALQAGGAHETGVAVTALGSADGKTPNLIVCDEGGRGYLLPHADVWTMENPPHLQLSADGK